MMQKYKVEALWDCIYCGSKGMKGGNMTCLNCGSSRGAEVRFYLPQQVDRSLAIDESTVKISSQPDWMCVYCRSYNSSERNNCFNCGAKREATNLDYINIHTRKKNTLNKTEETN